MQAQQSYLGNTIPFPLPVIAAIEVFVMAYVESKRGSETDRTKRMYAEALSTQQDFPGCRLREAQT